MNQSFATPPSNQRLILIFLGWGMDAAPFSSLSKPGYDIMLLSDYSGFRPDEDTDLLAASICNYQEIVVMAWSFGVRIAADFLAGWRRKLPITRAVAINGTTEHISDSCGIPLRIFQGTLETCRLNRSGNSTGACSTQHQNSRHSLNQTVADARLKASERN